MPMLRSVRKDGECYSYSFEAKKVKNFNMRVRRDGTVSVSAPYRVSMDAVDAFVLSHVDFIRKARERLSHVCKKEQPTVVNGAVVLFCGKSYTLAVKKGKEGLSFEGSNALLTLKTTEDPAAVAAAWEKCRKDAFYPVILNACRAREPLFEALGIAPPKEIRLRKMTSMWGNCRSDSRILTFSTMLAEVPPALRDYVVCHEFCHLKHPDHSTRFYALLSRVCPDYAEKRKALRQKNYLPK